MKCPHCGTDIKAIDPCPGCGRKVKLPPGIEVEYKDFKLSEYLEIRQKEQPEKQKDPSGGVHGEDKPAASPEGRKEGGRIASSSSPQGRRFLPAVIVILLVLAALAAALYLWKFLKP